MAALYDKGMTFDEVYEELKKMFAPKEEEKVEKKEGADDLTITSPHNRRPRRLT